MAAGSFHPPCPPALGIPDVADGYPNANGHFSTQTRGAVSKAAGLIPNDAVAPVAAPAPQ